MKRYIKSARSSNAYTPRGAKSKASDKLQGFDELQMEEMQKGRDSGIDVSIYADPKYNVLQMGQIRKGLEAGVDVSIYAEPGYRWDQMNLIRRGLELGVDVEVYADPGYRCDQMYEILEGLKAGIDTSIYADPQYTWYQMEQIREGLEAGLDVEVYADPKYTGDQMEQILEGLKAGVDVDVYTDPKYDRRQMEEIRRGLIRYANDPDIDTATAEQIAEAFRKGAPSLAWIGMSRNDRAKDRWSKVKDAAASRQPLDIPAIEEEFNLLTLEGAAASKLGLSFDENEDGSITFLDDAGAEVKTIDAETYDGLVKSAIAASSTRSSFTKAFMSRLKKALFL